MASVLRPYSKTRTMIHQILDLPENMIGFKAQFMVTPRDFDEVVIPTLEKHVEKIGQINYMLVLNKSIRNFTFYTSIKNILMGLKHLTKWNRAAIVTDSKILKAFIRVFSFFAPGEFRAFRYTDMKTAINWVSKGTLAI